jgi:hypothetical protein
LGDKGKEVNDQKSNAMLRAVLEQAEEVVQSSQPTSLLKQHQDALKAKKGQRKDADEDETEDASTRMKKLRDVRERQTHHCHRTVCILVF